MYFLGGAAVIHTLLNFIAIPMYGMWGALVSTVISYNLCGIAFMVYFNKKSGIPYNRLIFVQKQDVEDIKYYFNKSKKNKLC